MKNISRKMKISVLTAVSGLALSGVAFGSSAFAADPATPTPTVSSTIDSGLNVEVDGESLLDGIQSTVGVSGSEESHVAGTLNVDVQENDNEVDAINDENAQEQASFTDDISAAVQAGENEDAAQLSSAASIVASVTVPEVRAMASDDAEAHLMITGALKN